MKAKFHVLGVVMIVGLALALAACTAKSASPIDLAQKDSGSTQQVAVGQELKITLEANPTTGYQWSVDGALPAQLEQAGKPEYAVASTAIGSGGMEVWTFKGKSSGAGALKLKYSRSFEPTAAPANTFEVNVTVK